MPNEDYQNLETKQATARIESELYDRVTSNFHQGQLTTLFRNIFESLDELMKNGRLIDISNYIYKAKPLHLIPKKD